MECGVAALGVRHYAGRLPASRAGRSRWFAVESRAQLGIAGPVTGGLIAFDIFLGSESLR
jgi:hypothetical protein